jgi:hypothetical protein
LQQNGLMLWMRLWISQLNRWLLLELQGDFGIHFSRKGSSCVKGSENQCLICQSTILFDVRTTYPRDADAFDVWHVSVVSTSRQRIRDEQSLSDSMILPSFLARVLSRTSGIVLFQRMLHHALLLPLAFEHAPCWSRNHWDQHTPN